MVSTFPFGQDFVVLRDAMNQLLEESFVPSRGTRGSNGTVVRALPLDVYATQDEAVVIAAIPGMDPANLEITVNQNVVTVAGTIPSVAESEQGKGATWYLHELWHGQFRRSVTLPFEVDAGKAEATFEHGIVRVSLPKAERAKPFRIAIKGIADQEQDQAIEAGSTAKE
ncbi:MAG: Hsp20/alpha crystallin family protein [Thermomicrobiales bacterium]